MVGTALRAFAHPTRLYLFLFTGLRFSMNAAMPSERSSSAKVEWNKLRSTFMPSDNGVSNARLMASLAMAAAGRDIEAIFSAAASASSINLSAGTTRLTRPERSASAASIIRPVRHRSIALDLPIARVSRCVPPMPGMVPSVISGWPNFAISADRGEVAGEHVDEGFRLHFLDVGARGESLFAASQQDTSDSIVGFEIV